MPPNTPKQVSILTGIPLTKKEYDERIPSSDWLGHYHGQPQAAASNWRKVYSPEIAVPMLELREKALSLGARVTRATLAELARSTASSCVVVVMTHWKDGTVLSEDCNGVKERDPWLARCSGYASPLARWLAARLQPERRTEGWAQRVLAALSRRKKQELSVHQILEQSVTVELPEENPPPEFIQVRESMVTRAARRREELDSMFAGMIRPGNRLEMWDGSHSKETLEQWISPGFEGVLDLANCTSTILADYVSGRRKRRLRLVIAPYPIKFVATAPIVGSTLDLLATGNFSYQEARAGARKLWEGASCAT
jgi:hypothetical protein